MITISLVMWVVVFSVAVIIAIRGEFPRSMLLTVVAGIMSCVSLVLAWREMNNQKPFKPADDAGKTAEEN